MRSKNSFINAIFIILDFHEADEDDLNTLWKQLRRHGEVEENGALDDFLIADQALSTTGTRALEEIAESCNRMLSQWNQTVRTRQL